VNGLKILESVKSGELALPEPSSASSICPSKIWVLQRWIITARCARLRRSHFGKGKTPQQVGASYKAMLRKKDSRHNILVTRADAKLFAPVKKLNRAARFHALSGVITVERSTEITGKGTISWFRRGRSDIPSRKRPCSPLVMGNRAEPLYDVALPASIRLLDSSRQTRRSPRHHLRCRNGRRNCRVSSAASSAVPVIGRPHQRRLRCKL